MFAAVCQAAMLRHTLPDIWMMTDERQGDALWLALESLPRGAGVVFRHYRTKDRRTLFDRVRVVARRRGLLLLVAGSVSQAISWRADGVHGDLAHRTVPRALVRTASAHDARELVAARRSGAGVAFVSPIFATRSHPGAGVLGVARFGLLALGARVAIIALGGMTARRARRLPMSDGWAAIDAWTRP